MATYVYDAAGSVYGTATYDAFTVGAPTVELFLGGVWTDITAYVRIDQGISITRGRQDEQASPVPAQCSLTLANADGRFSPRNASGAYFGLIGRNTQLRVSVRLDDASNKIRFWGEVAEWPVGWDISQNDAWVNVTAAGARRRLGQGQAPIGSAYTRAETKNTAIVQYWPMEDGPQATQFGSAIAGAGAAHFSGTVTPSSDETFIASEPLPVFGGDGSFSALVPAYTPSVTGQQVRMMVKVTQSGTGVWDLFIDTSGAHYFVFEYNPTTNNGILAMFNYASGLFEASNGPFNLAQAPLTGGAYLSIELKQNGTGIDCNVAAFTPGATTGLSFGVVTIPASTLGRITGVRWNNFTPNVTTVAGQVSVENQISSVFTMQSALAGYAGESAAARTFRLATEQNVITRVPNPAVVATELLGAQREDTFLDLWDEAIYADDGLSTEGVDTFGLYYRARTEMYNQTTGFFIDYSHLDELGPTDDDRYLVNDVTVSRIGGASARRVDATSTVGVPTVGQYATEYDLSLYLDAQADTQAGWRLAEGTVDRPRVPVLSFDAVNNLPSAGRALLVNVREGDRVDLVSVPAFTGLASSTKLQVVGWSETIGYKTWVFNFVCKPLDGTSPSQAVFILDDAVYGILDTDRLGL